MALTKEQKEKVIKEFGANEQDTGSTAVQIAMISERVRELTEHLKINKHDFASKRGLLILLGRRKRYLRYLERHNEAQYKDVISRLGLKR